ncbi:MULTISPECIES: DUF1540 domain-containing protein [unclassified Cellulomonas]|uniref:DUF1540 domain-containing protein n=1 Tax=unclassified Cellulomonas TaxID=2620175 RepID=UPI001997B30F|nr:DUF1540 domain-containing protein [Cellulomonas sp. ES6]MBD3779353.1 DUF1540 domain-containing protein [Micrococcales bacterium]WHP16363.1 DUF1540 domain-containing protein [Cellulomonas sp. ES6]
MSTLMDQPPVSECSVDGCSYNHDHACSAAAITVGGSTTGDAQCSTFIPLSVKGGLDRVVSHVGACQRADCSHNEHLTCAADAVRIGAGHDLADCLTYAPA